jgi:magnesium transporter
MSDTPERSGPDHEARPGPVPQAQAAPEAAEAPDLESIHPADGADHLENLPIEEQVQLVHALSAEDAAEIVAEMERHDRATLMRELPADHAADILGEMSPDDAADLLVDLDQDHQQRLLRRVEREDAAEIRNLMTFDPDTAGGVMNTEVMVLEQDLTADQAISLIRKAVEDTEIPYYAYVVDAGEKLVGVLSLRDLLRARPRVLLKSLLKDQSLISAPHDLDKEEVARMIGRYNLLALPIVDADGKLMGVVTHDDVYDIIHEEASEDMLSMVGAGADETVDTPWRKSVAMRLPWLAVNVVNSAFSAWVVSHFEATISQMAILAVLMPIVANQAGNTGQQSLALMIRQMALETMDRKKALAAVCRETKIALVNGVILAAVVFVAVAFLTDRPALAGIMSLALGLDMLLGALAGSGVPLLLKALGRDPAHASTIFLTTLTDSAGFFFFLGLAAYFLL